MELSPILRKIKQETSILLLAFLANRKGLFGNFDVCDVDAVRVLAYLLKDSAKKLYQANTAMK